MTITERQICETLISLMLEKPFSKIKVTELTAKANISRSTFYSYFDSIYDVLQAMEDELIDHLIDEKDVSLQYSSDSVEKNLSYIRDHIQAFEVLTGPNGDASFLARMGNRSKRILLTIADDVGSNMTETQLTIINEFSRAGKFQILHWWAKHENEVSVKEIVDMLDRISSAMHGIVMGK